jgi:lipopolysaccharide export system protein LptA
MLRRARWLLLLALVSLASSVTWLVVTQRAQARRDRPKAALPLPDNTSATARDWTHDIKDGDRLKVRISARNFRQIKEPSTFLLDGLELRIYGAEKDTYDLVRTAQATFDLGAGSMYAEGEVEIEMDLSAGGGVPTGKLRKIRSSGVTFDSKTMRVSTPRHAEFEFEGGQGNSVGAAYDPTAKELVLESAAVVDWQGSANSQPMRLESSHVTYREAASEIFLSPPAVLRKEGFLLEAGETVVILQDGNLDRVEAVQAHGWDRVPGRELKYEAPRLIILFAPGGVIRRIEGSEQARLISTNSASQTTVDAKRIDLDFRVVNKDSLLQSALASGAARVASQALAKPGVAQPSGARVMTSEVIALAMRPDGKEIAQVETHTPGQVEFAPAKPGDKRRTVTGERISIAYGPGNVIETFRAVQAETRTEGVGKDKKPVISTTRSQDLQAWFDPQTGQMAFLEQWNNFEYVQEERRARAERARLDNARELITLSRGARVWDAAGSTTGDEIVLEQATGQMAASGNVTSTRLPDKKPGAPTGGSLLSGEEPMQARAARMVTYEDNRRIRYEGNAVVWQGANRVTGDTVLIDRSLERLEATGNVVTTFVDRAGARPAATVVRAPKFVYDGKARMGDYTGGAAMQRPTLDVRGQRLRAWFVDVPTKDGGTESQLDRIFADGSVTFIDRGKDRTRTGASEHAEHYPREERTVLTGGTPFVNDSRRGITRGDVITFLAREDRLIVDNTGSGPAVSRIQRDRNQ